MGFIGPALKLLNIILGLFGIGSKSDAEIGLDKGEQLGKAETTAAGQQAELEAIKKADDARKAVTDDPSQIASDPNNAGP